MRNNIRLKVQCWRFGKMILAIVSGIFISLFTITSSQAQSFDYNSGSVSVGPIYPLFGESGITVDNPTSWISVGVGSIGGFSTISVSRNFVDDGITSLRSATIRIGSSYFAVSQSGIDNRYTISPAQTVWQATDQSSTLTVAQPIPGSGASIQVVSGGNWLYAGHGGWSGTGFYIYLSSAANVVNDGVTSNRTATLQINNQTYTVTQLGTNNQVSITPSTLYFSGEGGTESIQVIQPNGSSSFTFKWAEDWITAGPLGWSPASGTTPMSINVTAKPFWVDAGEQTRQAVLFVDNIPISITQTSIVNQTHIDRDQVVCAGETNTTFQIQITSDIPGKTVTIRNDSSAWLSVPSNLQVQTPYTLTGVVSSNFIAGRWAPPRVETFTVDNLPVRVSQAGTDDRPAFIRVTGLVLDTATGQPITGALVDVQSGDIDDNGLTDANGVFEAKVSRSWRQRQIILTATDYSPQKVTVDLPVNLTDGSSIGTFRLSRPGFKITSANLRKNGYFIKDVGFPQNAVEVVVDWMGHTPGHLELIANGGLLTSQSVSDTTAQVPFSMDSLQGSNSRSTVQVVAYDASGNATPMVPVGVWVVPKPQFMFRTPNATLEELQLTATLFKSPSPIATVGIFGKSESSFTIEAGLRYEPQAGSGAFFVKRASKDEFGSSATLKGETKTGSFYFGLGPIAGNADFELAGTMSFHEGMGMKYGISPKVSANLEGTLYHWQPFPSIPNFGEAARRAHQSTIDGFTDYTKVASVDITAGIKLDLTGAYEGIGSHDPEVSLTLDTEAGLTGGANLKFAKNVFLEGSVTGSLTNQLKFTAAAVSASGFGGKVSGEAKLNIGSWQTKGTWQLFPQANKSSLAMKSAMRLLPYDAESTNALFACLSQEESQTWIGVIQQSTNGADVLVGTLADGQLSFTNILQLGNVPVDMRLTAVTSNRALLSITSEFGDTNGPTNFSYTVYAVGLNPSLAAEIAKLDFTNAPAFITALSPDGTNVNILWMGRSPSGVNQVRMQQFVAGVSNGPESVLFELGGRQPWRLWERGFGNGAEVAFVGQDAFARDFLEVFTLSATNVSQVFSTYIGFPATTVSAVLPGTSGSYICLVATNDCMYAVDCNTSAMRLLNWSCPDVVANQDFFVFPPTSLDGVLRAARAPTNGFSVDDIASLAATGVRTVGFAQIADVVSTPDSLVLMDFGRAAISANTKSIALGASGGQLLLLSKAPSLQAAASIAYSDSESSSGWEGVVSGTAYGWPTNWTPRVESGIAATNFGSVIGYGTPIYAEFPLPATNAVRFGAVAGWLDSGSALVDGTNMTAGITRVPVRLSCLKEEAAVGGTNRLLLRIANDTRFDLTSVSLALAHLNTTQMVAQLPAIASLPAFGSAQVLVSGDLGARIEGGYQGILNGNGNLTSGETVTVATDGSALLFALIDNDFNQMDDRWEVAHGLTLGDPSNASTDSDGDGFSNYQEYIFGTDPQSPYAFPSVAALAGATPVLQFMTASNRLYVIERSLDLKTWQPFGNPIQGTGSVVSIPIDTTDADNGFFRISAGQ